MRPQISRVIVFLSALAVMAAKAQAQPGGRESPICGNHLTIGNITYTLPATQNGHTGGCTGTVSPSDVVHVLGSPSGLATQSGTGTFPGLYMSTDAGGDELWVVAGGVSSFVPLDASFSIPSQRLQCIDEAAPEVVQPYIELTTADALLRPCFGGAGTLGITFLWGHEDFHYGPTGVNLEGRSTDTNGDGDTDEADMKALIAAFGTQNHQYDLNWDNSVDAADLAILLGESVRRDPNNNNQPYRRGRCDANGNIAAYDASNWRPIRPAAPPVTATPSCNYITVSWTNTGNDSLAGTASAFHVRRSSSAITNETQWASAIEVGFGAPGVSGTTGSVQDEFGPCSATYFYAVRMQDDEGNMSAISCIPSGAKTFCPHGGNCDDGLVSGDGQSELPRATSLSVGSFTAAGVEFRIAVPANLAGASAKLVIHDVMGRRVATVVDGALTAGEHSVRWNTVADAGNRAPIGVYTARFELGGESRTTKFRVIR